MGKLLGEKIKSFRKNNNISRDSLSKQLEISIHTLAKYEQGQRQPSIETLKKIAAILKVDINELTEDNYFTEKVLNILTNNKIDIFDDTFRKKYNIDEDIWVKLLYGELIYDDDELKETESSFIELLKYCCSKFSDELYPLYQGLKKDVYTLPTTFNKDNIIKLLNNHYESALKDKEEKINSQYETFFELCKKHCGFDISFSDNQFNVSNKELGLNYPISKEDFTEMFKDIRGYIFKELFYQSYKKFINKKEGD